MQYSYIMKWKLLARDLCIVFGAVAVGVGIMYGIMHYQQTSAKQNSVLAAQTEVDSLLGKVGKLIELPKEIPTLATVTDTKKLQGQPFFTDAMNGDKVLVFVAAKEAILFRPSENKIIKVAPITIQNTPSPEQNAQVTPTAVIIKQQH